MDGKRVPYGVATPYSMVVLDPARLAEEQPSTTPPALRTSEPTALVK